MTTRSTYTFILIAGLVIGFGSACTKQGIPHNDTQIQNTAKEQIQSFENDLKVARSMNLEERSKEDYTEAVKHFEKAKELARRGDDPEKFRETMHEARLCLDRAKDKVSSPAY